MNKGIIIGVVVLVVVVGAFVFLYLGDESEEITGEVIEEETDEVRPFIIVVHPWEPHIYYDEDGVVRGIAADVAERVFSRLNVSYEIRLFPWTRAYKMAQLGEVDATIMTGYTAERDPFLYYTEEERNHVRGEPVPHTITSQSDGVFFARNALKDGITFESLDDIREKDYKVGAVTGYRTTGELHDANITVLEYPDDMAQFQALDDGVVDLALVDRAIAVPLLKNMGLIDEISPFPQSFFKNPLYMPFSKKSDYPNLLDLREDVLEELRKIYESGEYDEIYNSYVQ
jgi:polar amino acid transport system substrate-binding protein